jgi:hypothetical protein
VLTFLTYAPFSGVFGKQGTRNFFAGKKTTLSDCNHITSLIEDLGMLGGTHLEASHDKRKETQR